MLDEALRRLIIRELEEIDTLLDTSSPLLGTPVDTEPSFERVAALSAVLESFYTGLERIFERIAKEVDSRQPEGERWHIELLNQVALQTESRSAVISEDSRERLRDYLAFRHRSRHASVHYLVWNSMAQLVASISQTWNIVRSEILQFLQQQSSTPSDEAK